MGATAAERLVAKSGSPPVLSSALACGVPSATHVFGRVPSSPPIREGNLSMNPTDLASRTLDGREATLAKEKIDDLRARHRGPVLLPGDPGFEDSRTVWNGMIDRRPAIVLRSLGVADVVTGVNFARTHGLALCVKGGGHNIAGLAVADGAVMLDLGLMRGVFVDPAAKIAHAQAGCLLGDVDRETQLHGLAAVLGFVSQTGIAGLTLGGGFGYLSRRYGWTSDN